MVTKSRRESLRKAGEETEAKPVKRGRMLRKLAEPAPEPAPEAKTEIDLPRLRATLAGLRDPRATVNIDLGELIAGQTVHADNLTGRAREINRTTALNAAQSSRMALLPREMQNNALGMIRSGVVGIEEAIGVAETQHRLDSVQAMAITMAGTVSADHFDDLMVTEQPTGNVIRGRSSMSAPNPQQLSRETMQATPAPVASHRSTLESFISSRLERQMQNSMITGFEMQQHNESMQADFGGGMSGMRNHIVTRVEREITCTLRVPDTNIELSRTLLGLAAQILMYSGYPRRAATEIQDRLGNVDAGRFSMAIYDGEIYVGLLLHRLPAVRSEMAVLDGAGNLIMTTQRTDRLTVALEEIRRQVER